MSRNAIAHVRQSDGLQQLLLDHLFETSFIAGQLASKLNLNSAGELLGLLHDFGKYSQSFQDYIKAAKNRRGRRIISPRRGVRFERTVHVSAEKLGISGVLDLVEVEAKTGRLKPVEYKRDKVCSLVELCQPVLLGERDRSAGYVMELFEK